MVKAPPAYRLLPEIANAETLEFIPEPKADQALPSQLTIRLAALPPAVVK